MILISCLHLPSASPACAGSGAAPVLLGEPLSFCGLAGMSCCDAAADAVLRERLRSLNVSDAACAAIIKGIICQGNGMTESAAVGTRGFNTSKQKKYASVGLLAPNMHARIVDLENGCYLPPGSCGELCLHGPAIMKGYLNDEDACTIIDGWLRTGDIAYFDSDGYLYIVGRLKDTIKYKGFQIAPADLEAVLIGHPEIDDVAVTCAEDEEAGQIPVAFVVRKSGSSLSCMQVMEYVAKKVSPYKKVRKVVFVESIPKSAAGKVLRRLLKGSPPTANDVPGGPRPTTSCNKSNSKCQSRL